jgi:uncharacterized membrane protein
VTDGTTFTTLDVPGAQSTQAFGISNNDQIVGQFLDATGYHGFVTDGATFTTIDVPGAIDIWVIGINDESQIVGAFSDAARPLVCLSPFPSSVRNM